MIILNVEGIKEKVDMKQTSRIDILMYFDRYPQQCEQKTVKIHVSLQMRAFFEDCQQILFTNTIGVFCFSFELDHLHYIKVTTKQHESVDGQVFK